MSCGVRRHRRRTSAPLRTPIRRCVPPVARKTVRVDAFAAVHRCWLHMRSVPVCAGALSSLCVSATRDFPTCSARVRRNQTLPRNAFASHPCASHAETRGPQTGRLKDWHPIALGAVVLDEVCKRAGIDPVHVDDVRFACTQAAQQQHRQHHQRQAASRAKQRPTTTLSNCAGCGQPFVSVVAPAARNSLARAPDPGTSR